MTTAPPSLVSAGWLAERLGQPGVKVVDASWHAAAANRDARDEFLHARIPGAQLIALEATDDPSPLPHTLPSEAFFADMMEKLGVGSDDHVVCYDVKGIFSSARLWYMLRAFGHSKASVLDGGLPAWRREGHAVESGPVAEPQAPTTPFKASLVPGAVCTFKEISEGIQCA